MSAHARTAPELLHLATTRAPEPVRRLLARAGLADLPAHAADLGVETIRSYDQQETRIAFTAPPREVNLFMLESISAVVHGARGASPLDEPAPESLDVPWWRPETAGAGRILRWTIDDRDVVEMVVDEARTRVWIRVMS